MVIDESYYYDAVDNGVIAEAHLRGTLGGLWLYAHTNDGVFYVGTTGRTLREAQDTAITEHGYDPELWRKAEADGVSHPCPRCYAETNQGRHGPGVCVTARNAT